MWNAGEASFKKSTSIVLGYVSLITASYVGAEEVGQPGVWYGLITAACIPLSLICWTRLRQHVVPPRGIVPLRGSPESKFDGIWKHGGLEPRVIREKMQDGSLGPNKFAIEIWYHKGENDRKSFAIPLSRRDLERLRGTTIRKLKEYPELQP